MPAMASFETINIVQAVPADVPLEVVLIVHIPALKFPVSPEPTGIEPLPRVRVMMLYVIGPVLDVMRRCVGRA